MLNSLIAMRPFLNWFVLFAVLIPGFQSGAATQEGRARTPLFQADSPNVVILTPVGGEALQGRVRITGSVDPEGFQSFSLSFAYHNDPTGTWFLIAEGDAPVLNTTLAEWSTFDITDGDYDLRLRVVLDDGSVEEDYVEGIRVRNYSQVETSTPQPLPTATLTPTPEISETQTPPPTEISTATPLAPNPAEFRSGQISQTIIRGAAGVMAAFILLGMYTSIRSPRKK